MESKTLTGRLRQLMGCERVNISGSYCSEQGVPVESWCIRCAARDAAATIERLEQDNARLKEFYDAQIAFDEEDEDRDRRAWEAAGERLSTAHSALSLPSRSSHE